MSAGHPVKNRGTGVAAAKSDYPLSTDISSPVQAASKRRIAQYSALNAKAQPVSRGYLRDDFVVSDDNAESLCDSEKESDDGFEQVRDTRNPRKSRKRALGPPITTDEKLERLNPTHRDIVDAFVKAAKDLSEKVGLHRTTLYAPCEILTDLFRYLLTKILPIILSQTLSFEKWLSISPKVIRPVIYAGNHVLTRKQMKMNCFRSLESTLIRSSAMARRSSGSSELTKQATSKTYF